jgi:hypothetical protein
MARLQVPKEIQRARAKRGKTFSDFKTSCTKLWDYYHNRYLTYVNSLIDNRFESPTARQEIKEQFIWINVTKKPVQTISTTYLEPAKRFLVDAKDKEIQAYEDIKRHSKMICFMPYLERIVNLLGTVIVKVSFRNGGIVYDPILPQNADVKVDPDDPTQLVEISYKGLKTVNGKENQIVKHTWTKDTYTIYDSKGNALENTENKENVNPYKDQAGNSVLPFVVFRKEYNTGEFFYSPPLDLLDIQEFVAVRLSDIVYAMHKETRLLLFIYGIDEFGDAKEINLERLTALVAPSQRDEPGEKTVGAPYANFLTPNAKIEQLWGSVKNMLHQFLISWNISPVNYEFAKTPSGVMALKFSTYPLDREQKLIKHLRRTEEHELFDITRVVHNFYAKRSNGIKWDTQFKIDFQEPKEVRDEQTNLTVQQQKINMGLKSTIDAKMEDNPDLSREEAEAELIRIKEDQKRIKGGMEEVNKEIEKEMGVEEGE